MRDGESSGRLSRQRLSIWMTRWPVWNARPSCSLHRSGHSHNLIVGQVPFALAGASPAVALLHLALLIWLTMDVPNLLVDDRRACSGA